MDSLAAVGGGLAVHRPALAVVGGSEGCVLAMHLLAWSCADIVVAFFEVFVLLGRARALRVDGRDMHQVILSLVTG